MIKKFEDFNLSESKIGKFEGKKKKFLGMGSITPEYQKHLDDNKTVDEWRETAKKLYNELDKFQIGECEKMWDYVMGYIGGLKFALLDSKGNNEDSMTVLGQPAKTAGWTYCPGWDSWCKIKDLDNIYTYDTGLCFISKNGNDNDLLEYGLNWVRSWLKEILMAACDSENGYSDFEDGTFFNCKNPEEIIKKVKEGKRP